MEGVEGGKSLFYMNRKKVGQTQEAGSSWESKSKAGLVKHSMKTILDTINNLGWKLEVLLLVLVLAACWCRTHCKCLTSSPVLKMSFAIILSLS